jgi:nicotinate-nucleotide pyrophosphorylase (carboxylating)
LIERPISLHFETSFLLLTSKKMEFTNTSQVKQLIDRATAEDLGQGDVTTEALIPKTQKGRASIVAKARGFIAGVEVAKQVFLKVDPELKLSILIEDGTEVKPGDIVAKIEGRVASILKAERVALNFLQHLSGIASETGHYVQAVKGLPVQITDTRKTTPGLRTLEKYAVRVGGGKNHRMHLGDGILIKDNHLAAFRRQGLSIKEIVTKARQKVSPKLKIEVEVKTPQEAVEAAEAGADIIMLDNMGLEDMRQAVQLIKGRTLIEASGGITQDRVRAVAQTGVDLISIGALTHSTKALDISLELD